MQKKNRRNDEFYPLLTKIKRTVFGWLRDDAKCGFIQYLRIMCFDHIIVQYVKNIYNIWIIYHRKI